VGQIGFSMSQDAIETVERLLNFAVTNPVGAVILISMVLIGGYTYSLKTIERIIKGASPKTKDTDGDHTDVSGLVDTLRLSMRDSAKKTDLLVSYIKMLEQNQSASLEALKEENKLIKERTARFLSGIKGMREEILTELRKPPPEREADTQEINLGSLPPLD
jgi:hypothetical protein